MSNRDIANLLILGLVLTLVLVTRSGRHALLAVLKALAGRLLIVIGVYLAYLAVVIFAAAKLEAWNTGLLNDTVVWVAMAGTALFGKFAEVGRYPRVLRRRLLEMVGAGALVEFVFNLVSFPLIVEVLMAVTLTFLYLVLAVAASKAETQAAANLVRGLLGALVLCLMVAAAVSIYRQRGEFEPGQLWRSFAMIFWLPLAAAPGVYVIGLYSSYEKLAMRLRWKAPERRWQLLAAVVISLRGRARLVHAFGGAWLVDLAEQPSFGAARSVVSSYRQAHVETPRAHVRRAVKRLSTDLTSQQPSTPAPMRHLAVERPPAWELLLYAAALQMLVAVVDDHHGLLIRGATMYSGRLRDVGEAVRRSENVITSLSEMGGSIEQALDPVDQDAAFGMPGEPGDIRAIVQLAGRLIDCYAASREYERDVRDQDVRPYSQRIVRLTEATACLAADLADQIRNFVSDIGEKVAEVPGQLNQEKPVNLSFVLTLELPQALLEEYYAALDALSRTHLGHPLLRDDL